MLAELRGGLLYHNFLKPTLQSQFIKLILCPPVMFPCWWGVVILQEEKTILVF